MEYGEFLAAANRLISDKNVQEFIAACIAIGTAPAFRFFVYLIVVAVTIWVIARIYSGELQNAERGPIAIRPHVGVSNTADTLVVHRDIVPLTMDGVHARCTFVFTYDGHNGKRQHVHLLTRQLRLNVTATRLAELKTQDATERGNTIVQLEPEIMSNDVYWPTLDIEDQSPTIGHATPDRAAEYLVVNKVLERWSGDDGLNLISLHPSLLSELRDARAEFTKSRIERLRLSRAAPWWKKWRYSNAPKNRPGAVGTYFIRFRFSNDPWFVLSRHPDREVRMTAWLTVLTSLFSLALELFPLNADRPSARGETSQQSGVPTPGPRR